MYIANAYSYFIGGDVTHFFSALLNNTNTVYHKCSNRSRQRLAY